MDLLSSQTVMVDLGFYHWSLKRSCCGVTTLDFKTHLRWRILLGFDLHTFDLGPGILSLRLILD
jgi:hypothetical protein